MSVKVMAQVWELDLPQGEKFVLLAFADHADDDGVCRPSVERVAWKTGYEKRQVIRIGKKLRESGLLKLLKPARPQLGLAAVYRIHSQKGLPLPPFKSSTGDKMSSAIGDISASTGDISASTEDIAMSSQPSLTTIIDNQKSKSAAKAAATRTKFPEGFSLTFEMQRFAETNGVANALQEFEAFSDFHRSRGNRFVDWVAAWRTWVRQSKRFAAEGGGHGKSGAGRARNAVHSGSSEDYAGRERRTVLEL